jgi:phenylalanine-4-hydroxylase
LGDPGVNGRIILKCIFRKWVWGMDWIDLAQERDRWQALVNKVMNLWASIKCGEFLDYLRNC